MAAMLAKRAAAQHALRELDVEPLFQGEHQGHARLRGEAGVVEIAVLGEDALVHGEPAMLAEDGADAVGDDVCGSRRWP